MFIIYVVYILLKVFVLRTVVSETFPKWSSLHCVWRPFRHDYSIKFQFQISTNSFPGILQQPKYECFPWAVKRTSFTYICILQETPTNERTTNLNQQPPPWKKKKDKALSSGIVIIILLCLHLKQQTTISQISNFWRHH